MEKMEKLVKEAIDRIEDSRVKKIALEFSEEELNLVLQSGDFQDYPYDDPEDENYDEENVIESYKDQLVDYIYSTNDELAPEIP